MQGHAVNTDVYTRPAKELGVRGVGRLIDNNIMNYASLASKIDIETVKNHQVQCMSHTRYRGKWAWRPLKY